jgi:hypothetical protein
MEPLSFENVESSRINNQIKFENIFNTDLKSNKKGKQTCLVDFIKILEYPRFFR